MGVTLDVPTRVLDHFKARWDDAADQLDSGWRRLAKTRTAGLSPQVTSAVEAFLGTWTDEVKRLAGVAQDHSDAFVKVGGDFVITDVAQAEKLRGLLSWADHDAAIEVG